MWKADTSIVLRTPVDRCRSRRDVSLEIRVDGQLGEQSRGVSFVSATGVIVLQLLSPASPQQVQLFRAWLKAVLALDSVDQVYLQEERGEGEVRQGRALSRKALTVSFRLFGTGSKPDRVTGDLDNFVFLARSEDFVSGSLLRIVSIQVPGHAVILTSLAQEWGWESSNYSNGTKNTNSTLAEHKYATRFVLPLAVAGGLIVLLMSMLACMRIIKYEHMTRWKLCLWVSQIFHGEAEVREEATRRADGSEERGAAEVDEERFGTGINGWLGERQVVHVGGFGRNIYVNGQCVYLGATDAEAMAAAAAAESGAESIAGRHDDSNMLEECEQCCRSGFRTCIHRCPSCNNMPFNTTIEGEG